MLSVVSLSGDHVLQLNIDELRSAQPHEAAVSVIKQCIRSDRQVSIYRQMGQGYDRITVYHLLNSSSLFGFLWTFWDHNAKISLGHVTFRFEKFDHLFGGESQMVMSENMVPASDSGFELFHTVPPLPLDWNKRKGGMRQHWARNFAT